MKERIFTDENNEQLIVQHRKSAVFFLRKADIEKPNSYSVQNAKNGFGKQHEPYVCATELKRSYRFSDEVFKEFHSYCSLIANESWSNFKRKGVDSWSSDYDDYYDKDFDNNGNLSIQTNGMKIGGPYTQLKCSGEIVRLIKFNKRKFESFIFDLNNELTYGPYATGLR